MSWVRRPGHPLADEMGFVEKHLVENEPIARSDLPFPMVMSDQIELRSMVDGKTYTSKRGLEASYRASGHVVVGNEWLKNEPKAPKPKIDRKAIRDSVGRAFNRAGIST